MKKQYLLSFTIFGFLIQSSEAQMQGNGTQSNPYQVTTCAELQQLQNNLSAYYVLMNDIDCSQTQTGGGPWGSTGFTPIGTDSAAAFRGNFNGRCFAIKNLYINNPTLNYVGVFGYMDGPGKVANVNVIDATVTGGDFTGILVGYKHSSTLDTTYTTGYVSGADYTGGVVGKCGNYQGPNCQITNTFSKAVVSGHDFVGGVVGQIRTYQGGWALLQNCFATGDVSGNNYVGGLSGGSGTYEGGEPEIYNGYATGNVTGVMDVGGLSGWVGPYQGGGSLIQRSYATGTVNGTTNVGGLIGSNGPTSGGGSTVQSTYARGNVTGTTNVGGLIGYQDGIGIGYGVDTSYSSGLVSGTTDVGGLIGNEAGTAFYDTCFWNNTINSSLQSIGNLGSYPSIYPSSTAQMQTQSTYLAWDFTKTWAITPGNYPTFIPLNTSGNCHFPATLEAAFNYSTFPACIGDSVYFTDESSDNPASWSWNFGDPLSGHNTSTLQNPAHLFSGMGTFTVTLIAVAGVNSDTIATPVIVINCTTSAQAIAGSNCNILVYPNPGTGIFNFNMINLPVNSTLQVFNVIGEKVLEKPLQNYLTTTTIDLSNEAKGVYFYKLNSASGVEKNGKLVVE
jgi:hypothetical protein